MKPYDGKNGSGTGILASVGRALRVSLAMIAGALAGGACSYVLSLARGNRTFEQLLGGAAIGGIAGAFWATRYRYSLGMGLGALAGWNLSFAAEHFGLAPLLAVLAAGGVRLVQRRLLGAAAAPARAPINPRTGAWLVLWIPVGMVLGGLLGYFLGGWLCMVFLFGAYLPSQLSPTLDQGGIAIVLSGFVGVVIGAATGGRCAYLWTIRRQQANPDRRQTIECYQQWKLANTVADQSEAPPPPADAGPSTSRAGNRNELASGTVSE